MRFLLITILIIYLGVISQVKAGCPPGPNLIVPTSTTVVIDHDGPCYYEKVIINGILTVPPTTDTDPNIAEGKKLHLIISDSLIINPGGGIDVSGRGDEPLGKGEDGEAPHSPACLGVFGGGGGGGGHAAKGGKGGTDATAEGGEGGNSYGDPNNPTHLGARGGNGANPAHGGGYGGLGGGAVIIEAKKVEIKSGGYIYANGEKGGPGGPAGGCDCSVYRDATGGGGGGSGGTINIQTEEFIFDGEIQANGGDGGDEYNSGGFDGSGGGGAGGRIYIFYKTRIGSGTISAEGGNPGELACGVGVPGGSGEGEVGTVVNPCTLGILTCDDVCLDSLTVGRNGNCNTISGKCEYPITESCDDGNLCTYDFCKDAQCVNIKTCGGLVPCGRKYDDLTTPLFENCPCRICHFLIMTDRGFDFLIFKLLFPLAFLMIFVGGFTFLTAGENERKIRIGKGIIKITLFSVIVIFSVWIFLNLFFNIIGVAEWTGLKKGWWKITCAVPGEECIHPQTGTTISPCHQAEDFCKLPWED